MSVGEVPDIGSLYERISDYDLVLTGQASLADALNSRLDRPRLDKLVYTPRGLVYREETGRDTRDRQQLFLEVVDRTELSWKEALYYLENVLDCWQETGRMSAIREYDRLDPDPLDQVLDVLQSTESVFQLMEQYEWDEVGDVAVLGSYQLKDLDRRVLPEEYDEVDIFDSDESASLEPFLIYPSANGLVNSMLGEIEQLDPSDVAIVMEADSPYQSLVASALQAREIPCIRGRSLTEDQHFRTLFTFMRLALRPRRLTLRDVRPILSMMGTDVSPRDEEKFLEELSDTALESFKEFVSELPSITFEEAIERYRDLTGETRRPDDALSVLNRTLNQLGLAHDRVATEPLNRLEFYLDSFDEPVHKSRHGVLLASPKSESFVDRSVVFYVGMGADWTRHVPDNPWVDRREHRKRHIRDFQVLLQNGQRRYYLVQEQRLNEPVTPCFYFNVLFDDEFETFSDRNHQRMTGGEPPSFRKGTTFDSSESTPSESIEAPRTISQSTLNTLVRSPRDYQFDQLVSDPETIYMTKGNLYHDYAEFYVNHPDMLETMDDEEAVDLMVDRLKPFLENWREPETRTEFHVGISNIREFLDEDPPVDRNWDGYESNATDNLFAEHFDQPIESSLTEAWFENPELGAHGSIDLVHSPAQLIDYKSGRSSTRRSVVRESNVRLLDDDDDPNFQAIMYLAHHRRQVPDRPLDFTFFHFMDNLSDRVQGQGLLEDTIVRVTYYPRTFAEQVPRRSTVDYLRSSNNRRKVIDKIGEDKLLDFFRDHPVENALDKSVLLESQMATTFEEWALSEVGDHKYVRDGCESILKELVRFRIENYFKEDLDRFETFLSNRVDDLAEYLESGFPVEGWQGEVDLDRLRHRELIVRESS